LGYDGKTREELIAEINDLRARLAATEEALFATRKSRNNHVRKHAEDEIAWAKERNHERARVDELLQFEKVEHRHSEEELGKTRDQLREVSEVDPRTCLKGGVFYRNWTRSLGEGAT